jgi:hypothetical protein
MAEYKPFDTFDELLLDLKIRQFNNEKNWSEYVIEMSKLYNKDIWYDEINYQYNDDYKNCYCCYVDNKPDDMKYVTFRYKPHKSRWDDYLVCDMCFNALQNKNFKHFEKHSCDGYPGILINDIENGWWYKDSRKLNDLTAEYQNLDYDPKVDGPCEKNDSYYN